MWISVFPLIESNFELNFIFRSIHSVLFSPQTQDDCEKDGTTCTNGACLDSLCHCNDGYGGCNCQVPGKFDFFFTLRSYFLN